MGDGTQNADNTLTIRGEKKSERAEKEKDYHLVERTFASFSRSVQLPQAEKKRRADYIIDTDQPITETRDAVRKLVEALRASPKGTA